MIENLKLILGIAGLLGFVAMLIGLAVANRRARREIAAGRELSFSWARFLFSIYLFAQGGYAFVNECLYERHSDKGVYVNYLFQSLSVLLLAIGITALSNQVRWLVYSLRGRRGL